MRILLIQPECQSSKIGFRFVAMPEPLALEMIAATVPEHDLRILDMRIDPDLTATLEQFSPDVVGVTALREARADGAEAVAAGRWGDIERYGASG